MSRNQKFENELHTLYLTDRKFIHQLLEYELKFPITKKDSNNNNLLHQMILQKDFKGIDYLLSYLNNSICDSEVKNFILNGQNKQLNTPIHLAVINGHQDVAKKLGKLGVNLSLPNNEDFVIKMTESERNTSSRNQSNDKERTLSTTSSESKSTNMKDILSNLLKPFIQSAPQQSVPQQSVPQQSAPQQSTPQRISLTNNNSKPLELTTISSTEVTPTKKKHTQVPNVQVPNVQSITINTDSQSDRISTAEFMRYLKKTNVQSGGANIGSDVQTVKGSRKIKNGSKKIESDNNTNTGSVASDSLGISQLLADQMGGRKSKSAKYLTSKLSSRSTSAKSSRSSNASRKNKPSSEIHIEVIDMIKKLGYTEDDARYIKAGLYQQIKDLYPDLSNLQRANQLKKMANAEDVKKIVVYLPKLKELVTKAREQRSKERETSEKSKDNKAKGSKDTKAKVSKEPKEPKEPKEQKASKEPKASKTSKESKPKKASRSKK
jgi:hypothetical protein